MTTKDTEYQTKLFEQLMVLFEDVNASRYCSDLWLQLQLMDDVYDEGKTTSKEEALQLINLSLVEIPNNPFYKAYYSQLNAFNHSIFLQWASANKMETEKRDLDKAYMLRAFVVQVFHYVGALLKGTQFAFDNSDIFQALYGETFNDYVEEFKQVA